MTLSKAILVIGALLAQWLLHALPLQSAECLMTLALSQPSMTLTEEHRPRSCWQCLCCSGLLRQQAFQQEC